MKLPKISSDFAILDVMRGRKALERLLTRDPDARIPVVIHGWLDSPHSNDDGTSIEFSVHVTSVDMPDETP